MATITRTEELAQRQVREWKGNVTAVDRYLIHEHIANGQHEIIRHPVCPECKR